MKKTFNDFVEESRKELEIINSKTLNNMIKEKEDLIIIDVNDKEEVEQRGRVKGAVNISLLFTIKQMKMFLKISKIIVSRIEIKRLLLPVV